MTKEDKDHLETIVDRIIDASKGEKNNTSERAKRARAMLENTVDIMVDDKLAQAFAIIKLICKEPDKIFAKDHDPSRVSIVSFLIQGCFGESVEMPENEPS